MHYILFVFLFFVSFSAFARPIVVELYTSQGCSSCPPADELLSELSEEDEVIALSFHVDYWNDIGWTDPFSKPIYSSRQRAYGSTMGSGSVYTPQAIIDGTFQAVGSSESKVRQHIKQASESYEDIPVTVINDDGKLKISIAGQMGKRGDVVIIGYNKKHETQILRGENKGRTIKNNNVVHVMDYLGKWDGNNRSYIANKPNTDNFIVLLQEEIMGKILGTGQLI